MKTIKKLYEKAQKNKKIYEEHYAEAKKQEKACEQAKKEFEESLLELWHKYSKSVDDYEDAVWKRL